MPHLVEAISAKIRALGETISVYGEAYGGSQQKMSRTYGLDLRFIVFDVRINESWLSVPNAHDVACKLGLDFVPYEKGPATIEWLDAQRDKPSVQAARCGITEPRPSEGIVVRPPVELHANGGRIIAKYKRREFEERASPTPIDPAKLVILEQASAIADEWVTPMRLAHVLDKLGNPGNLTDIPTVIKALTEDVLREASGEIVDSKAARKAIGARAVKLFKEHLEQALRGQKE